ncbi:MAG: cobyric acid synthase [Acidobacteriota bacterium]
MALTGARCLAILGTGSDAGKSVVVTALCRIFSDMGLRVAPFKAQNMSNNSYVTPDRGEIGRAQVVQAEAARAPLHVDMNPVLLKPSSDTGAQIVLHGRPLANREAGEYFKDTAFLFEKALGSLNRLRASYDFVVLEGAGSCAEVNLLSMDIVNMRMAAAADAPVILVADIDRGGVFAQIIGTLDVLPPADSARIRGFIINRFRGDAALFEEGIRYIEERTQRPVLGLIPYFHHIEIDCEDGMSIDTLIDPPGGPDARRINIAVLRLPHISNFTDFSPLQREPSVALHYLMRLRPLVDYDVVFLPGTKNVRADLEWMRREHWDSAILDYSKMGGRVVGICGGYQMSGRLILDPNGIEGNPGDTQGLGLLDIRTTIMPEKKLETCSGVWIADDTPVEGYEIHMGITDRLTNIPHIIRLQTRSSVASSGLDGSRSSDGRIWGTYLHGLFDGPEFRSVFLKSIDRRGVFQPSGSIALHESLYKQQQYDLLAQHFKSHLDIAALMKIARIGITPAV